MAAHTAWCAELLIQVAAIEHPVVMGAGAAGIIPCHALSHHRIPSMALEASQQLPFTFLHINLFVAD